MEINNLLVRNLAGKTLCLHFASSKVSCEDVKAAVEAREGIPAKDQRILAGTGELRIGGFLVADEQGLFPSCELVLRLLAGKGGFGSLLRGATTKAGQKKTSNFDACRDMSGRRLRHVNAEKKLKEWKAEARDRELEKTAEEFLKKQRKTEEEDKGMERELQKFRDESKEVRKEIGSAVEDGLVEAAKLAVSLKRKKVLADESETKKTRTWSPTDPEEEDEDEEFDEEDGAGPSSSPHKNDPSSSGSEKGEPSVSGSKDEAGSSSSDEMTDPSKMVSEQTVLEETLGQSRSSEAVELPLEFPEPSWTKSPDSSSGNEGKDQVVDEPTISSRDSAGPVYSFSSAKVEASAAGAHNSTVEKDVTGPLDFENYNTSKHLEVLGLDRLKTELQNRGLKCGGSLSERAARLFLLKTTPLEKLDKSLFSKPSGKNAKKKISG